ncbi:MAG TPA: cell division protein FtsH, partial [Candidatus Limnocylindrales bacterium]
GHALVAKLLPGADPIHKVTIIPRGMALGLTQQLPMDEKHTYPREYLLNNLVILFGGRVAEELVLNHMTTGAGNDIEKATDLARRMVTEFGMSDRLGPLSFGKRDELVFLGREIGEQRNYSDEVAKTIDEEVRAIIDKAYERATDVLTVHRDKLIALAEKLVAEETVDSDAFEALFSDMPPKEELHGIPTIVGPGQPVPEANPQPA